MEVAGHPIKGPFGDRLYCAYCDTLEGPFMLVGGRLVCSTCRDVAVERLEQERAAAAAPRIGDLRSR